MRSLPVVIKLLSLLVVTQAAVFNCGKETKLTDKEGILHIDRNVSECEFTSESKFFAFKSSGLSLEAGDRLELDTTAAIEQTPVRYEAPFQSGYYISGIEMLRLKFYFNKTDNGSMNVEFIQSSTESTLTLNGDLTNNLNIVSNNFTGDLTLMLKKTITDPVVVTITNARFTDSKLAYRLIDTASTKLSISLQSNLVAKVTTEVASGNCSKTYIDTAETSHDLSGPSDVPSKAYKCVNIFKLTPASQSAHYDVNFKDFLGLKDTQDELIIKSETSKTPIYINMPTASNYAKQISSFDGKELAVVYSSPGTFNPSQIQFKLTVEAKMVGGILEPATSKPIPLVLPANGPVRYVIRPQPQEYAAIEVVSTKVKLLSNSLKISSGDSVLASFTGDIYIPQLIVASAPNEDLVLEFSGSSLNAFSMNAKSIAKSCNKISEIGGRFLLEGGTQEECSWILASKGTVGLEVKKFEKEGCLTIQPLDRDTPVFDKCNITSSEMLPIFNLEQTVVRVKLSNDSSFDASIVAPLFLKVKSQKNALRYNISSYGYPSSNGWSKKSEVYTVKSMNKSSILTVHDVDLRDNEKLTFNNTPLFLSDELLLTNKTANLTISRSDKTEDFGFHRGFNVIVSSFDHAMAVPVTAKSVKIPQNVSTFYLRVSAPGKRITYNISSVTPFKLSNFSIVDGRTILGRASTKLNETSTSDTLILTGNLAKTNSTLSQITVNFDSLERNKTDHVCDGNSRSVPLTLLCQGSQLCDDGSDLKISCSSSGPINPPRIIETGVAGFTVFILSVLMLILGAATALYGPDLYKILDSRLRNGQYTSFSSTE